MLTSEGVSPKRADKRKLLGTASRQEYRTAQGTVAVGDPILGLRQGACPALLQLARGRVAGCEFGLADLIRRPRHVGRIRLPRIPAHQRRSRPVGGSPDRVAGRTLARQTAFFGLRVPPRCPM